MPKAWIFSRGSGGGGSDLHISVNDDLLSDPTTSLNLEGFNITGSGTGGLNEVFIPTTIRDDLANRPTATDAPNCLFIAEDDDDNMSWSDGATWDALDAKVSESLLGQPSGVATLDSGGKVPVAQLPSGLGAAPPGAFGDGSDGNVTISGTTNMTRDMFYDTLTVQNGGILNTLNYRVYAKTLCQIDAGGSIRNNGTNGGNPAGGSNTATGSVAATNITGGAGGTAAGNAVASSATNSYGGNGGAGGAGSGGGGGAPGTATAPTANLGSVRTYPMNLSGLVAVGAVRPQCGGSGGGGGGDGTAGGGGGAGGCVVFINAKAIINNGTIEAKGGNGASPVAGNRGGGGGGGGGWILLNSQSYTGSGSTNVSGGTGGTKTGTGVNGTDGSPGTVFNNVWS